MESIGKIILAGFLGILSRVFTEAADHTDQLSWKIRQSVRQD